MAPAGAEHLVGQLTFIQTRYAKIWVHPTFIIMYPTLIKPKKDMMSMILDDHCFVSCFLLIPVRI
jgi:hypothetical protein